ncbi:MAG: hypothetical protein GY781_19750 [Gammaproteobacteria bacterium]|nr:hypothetical protein [Gammaproteobacteria bacterium]
MARMKYDELKKKYDEALKAIESGRHNGKRIEALKGDIEAKAGVIALSEACVAAQSIRIKELEEMNKSMEARMKDANSVASTLNNENEELKKATLCLKTALKAKFEFLQSSVDCLMNDLY